MGHASAAEVLDVAAVETAPPVPENVPAEVPPALEVPPGRYDAPPSLPPELNAPTAIDSQSADDPVQAWFRAVRPPQPAIREIAISTQLYPDDIRDFNCRR